MARCFALLVCAVTGASGLVAQPWARAALGGVHLQASPRPAQTPATPPRRERHAVAVMGEKKGFSLPFLLDPNTKGGIVFYTILAIALPFFAYDYMLNNLGFDVVVAGAGDASQLGQGGGAAAAELQHRRPPEQQGHQHRRLLQQHRRGLR